MSAWTRHDHPIDRRLPVRAVRYSLGVTHVRADEDAIHVDGEVPKTLDSAAARELAAVLEACAEHHADLANRRPIQRRA